jgi:hypothetical protein
MVTDDKKNAHLQIEYGSEGSLKLTWLLLILVIALIASSFSLRALYHRIPKPKYFALTEKHELFEMPPLNEPSLSLPLLQNWVTTFALTAHSFDFKNLNQQLLEMKKYFTDEGYREYLSVMADFSASIKSDLLIVSCSLLEAPAVQRSTVIDNLYEWYVQVPILIRYDSSSTYKNERRNLSLVIKRTDTIQNPYGISISMFISK